MRDPIVPPPGNQELLSSFMTRLAHRHGLGAYRYFSYWLPQIPIWNRDIDRSVSNTVLRTLANLTGLDLALLQSMTLRDYEHAFATSGASEAPQQGIAPWINTLGIYHRTRRRFGLQYCPACLSPDEPIFIKPWRIACVTACPYHHCLLHDCCHHCGAVVIPHRNNVSPCRCHVCHRWLHEYTSHGETPIQQIDHLLALQDQYLGISDWISGSLKGVCRAEILWGMRVLMYLLRSHRRRHRRHSGDVLKDAGTCTLELARVHERAAVLLFQYRLLKEWPQSFKSIAKEAVLTQQICSSNPELPDWLREEWEQLPQASRRPRHNGHADRFPSPADWRSQRAAYFAKHMKQQ